MVIFVLVEKRQSHDRDRSIAFQRTFPMGKAEFHYLSNHLRELVNPSNEYICSQGYTIPLSNSPPRVRGKRINRHPRFLPRNANVFIAGTFHGGDKQNRSALLSLIPKPRINVPPGGAERERGKLDVKRFAVTIKARYRSGGGLDVKYRGEEEQVEFSFPLLDRIYSGVIRVVSRLRPGNDGIDFVLWKTRYISSLEIHCAPSFPPLRPFPAFPFLPRFSPAERKNNSRSRFASTTRRNSVLLWRTIISASLQLVQPTFGNSAGANYSLAPPHR